jgi:hypothetical protein
LLAIAKTIGCASLFYSIGRPASPEKDHGLLLCCRAGYDSLCWRFFEEQAAKYRPRPAKGSQSMALTGHVDEISRQVVTGWAMDTDHPDQNVRVVIVINGQEHTRLTTSILRPELKEAAKASIQSPSLRETITGRYGFELIFNPCLSVFAEQRIEVKFDATGLILPKGSRTLRRPPSAQATSVPMEARILTPLPHTSGSLFPIILTSAGRSGGTLLMQKLASHPQIVVAERYPFEIRLAAYYSAAFRTLISNADRQNSTNPDTMFGQRNQYSIGFNPYNRPGFYSLAKNPQSLEHFFEEFVPTTLGRTFRELLLKYYTILQVDQDKLGARYFAEKGDLDEAARQGPRIFFDTVREIVLVRDPRDLLCSFISFWKNTMNDAVQQLKSATSRLRSIHDRADSDTIFVKYEDLVTKSVETMEQIYQFVGLDSTTGPGRAEETSLFQKHGTSATPEASIGRWRADLSQEAIAVCDQAFRPFIERFGYTT